MTFNLLLPSFLKKRCCGEFIPNIKQQHPSESTSPLPRPNWKSTTEPIVRFLNL